MKKKTKKRVYGLQRLGSDFIVLSFSLWLPRHAAWGQSSAETTTDLIQGAAKAWSLSMEKVGWSFVVLLIGWLAITYLAKLLEAVAEHWVYFRLMIKRSIPILRVGGWTLVLYIVVADVLAPPIQTLVALTASAGIAVGFASQDILKNIFGGVIILFDRPFQIGDKVEVGKYYGEVTHIGLRTVRIVTPDDSWFPSRTARLSTPRCPTPIPARITAKSSRNSTCRPTSTS